MSDEQRLNSMQHDLNNTRQQIGGIFKELEDMKHHSAELGLKIDRLLILLEGDKVEPSRGFIPRLIAMEKLLTKFERMRSYYTGKASGIVFIAGLFIGLILGIMKFVEIVQHLLHQK